MEKIKIIAIIGKAGSGKDTIATELTFQYPELVHPIISCTSRPPREKESHGKDYYFLTKEEFEAKDLKGEMLETTSFNHWHYGTSYDSLSKSKINIGVFNPDGIKRLIKDDRIDLYVCYVRARDKTRLLR